MSLFDFDFEGYCPPKEQTYRERKLANRTRWDKMEGELFIKTFMCALSSYYPEKSVKGLLDDLLTDKEWKKLAQRIQAAQLIFMVAPYKTIAGMTGLRNASIASLSKRMADKRYGLRDIMSKLRRTEIAESAAKE